MSQSHEDRPARQVDSAEDDELARRIRAGDRDAFEELAARLRGRLYGLLRSRLGPQLRQRVDVEDLLQETHLRAFRSLERFSDGGAEAFFRWLGGIGHHVVMETVKREKRDIIVPVDVVEGGIDVANGEPSGATAMRRRERFDRLCAAIETLAPDHREVILLARIERLPMSQIAERMGRSPEAVSQLLWRAMKKLEERFGTTDSFHLPDLRLDDQREPPSV